MAINSNDVSYSIIPESTLGTTPTTLANRYELPVKAGQALPTFKANEIKSETMRPNRASNGSRRGNGSGEAPYEFAFQKDPAIELLMASAVSGTWAEVGPEGEKVMTLKAGKTDTSFSTIAKLASNMFETSKGSVVSGMTLSAKAAEGVSVSFDSVFINRVTGTSDNAISVTASPGNQEFDGGLVSDITVAGQVLQYTELSFSVKQDRTMRNVLGSRTPIGVGASGNREVTLTVKAYRESFAIDAAVTGEPQEVSFKIGEADDGYTFILPAAYGAVPYGETAESMMVVLEFTAAWSDDAQTDLVIEQL